MNADPGTILWIAGGLCTILTVLCEWSWSHTHSRIDKAWEAIDLKTSVDELNRQRENISETRYRSQTNKRILSGLERLEVLQKK